MKQYILALGFLLMFVNTYAQKNGKITGKVIDADLKEAISEANVRILNQKDSTFFNGAATNEKGNFSLSLPLGNYIVHITYVGNHDFYKNVVLNSAKPTVDIGTVELIADNILLDAAVVTAKAAEIVVKGDTVEYNADSYKVTESAVLEDLFKKMPGVEIDENGKITINGREVKKIMVDGEEFFSSDPKVASKNLPAKMVDKVQVHDRRTDMSMMTGFDDGDEETVINLTVRPGMKEGLFGNAFAGYGSQDRYEGNMMVNYMKDKNQYTLLGGLNNTNNAGFSDLASSMFGGGGGGRRMFWGGTNGITKSENIGFNFVQQFNKDLKLGGNLRFGQTDNNTLSKTHTQNILSSGNTFENENNASNNYSQNYNIDLRMEWTPDTLTKIIFSPQASVYNNNRTETSDFLTTRENALDTINHGDSRYYSDGNGKNLSGRLDISRTLGKKGRILSAQLSGGISDSENRGSNISNTFYKDLSKDDDLIDQKMTNTNDSRNWRGYFSYVEPIGNNNAIQVAYQYRQNFSESDRDTRIKDENGNYTILDELYSKKLENNFTNQEVELNFQSVRSKFDYTVGFSVQPSTSHSKTFVGENKIDDFSRSVVNYAPTAQFNYRWSRQHNLRLRYFGNTDQPSVQQLSPVVDVSNPLNITYGNPDLKPSFQHRMNIRYHNFNPEKNRSMGLFGNIGYLTNDIVSSTVTDRETGKKETTFENVSGNWNANGRMMFNLPLKNIKFSIFSMSFVSYNHNNGFSNGEKNLSRRTNLGETLGLNYRSDQFDFGIRGNVNYNNVKNSLEGQRDQDFINYGGNATTTIYLPWDMSIESDLNYSTNSGYADGFTQNEWLWNASIQKQLFKQKSGTLRFKIYDILQQRSNISRSVTANYIRDTTTNTLTSYFMVHFVYRFNIFKGGASADDLTPTRGMGRGYGGGHGRPGDNIF